MADEPPRADEPGVTLRNFTAVDEVADLAAYVAALEAFDRLEQLRELKALAIERTGVAAGRSVLDVGCGFGLETLRLAHLVGPAGHVAGIDASAAFIAEAERRARSAGLAIDFRTGDAQSLPYPDAGFDIARAERVLIYLSDPARALAEMRRVTRAGSAVALIEPDFDTNTINVPDRGLTRRILAHECDAGVVQGWLVRDLYTMMEEAGLHDIRIATRVVIFDPGLAAGYFAKLGVSARQAGVIGADELAFWTAAIGGLHRSGRLFCTIGYYLFTARV